MKLPSNFLFSQGNLQDYVDCPRRFQLRYILRRAWPALQAEPALENEQHLQQGAAFHRLVHQHVLGIAPERLSSTATGEDLSRWWQDYLGSTLARLGGLRYPEIILSAPVGHGRETGPSMARLIARYDLIVVGPGQRAVIWDWKTFRKRPRRKWLAGRLQTRVYPYLLVRAGAHLNGGQPFQPEQVEMVYWFTNFPGDPERFPYDAAQFQADAEYLTALIEKIKNLGPEDFPLTAQERHCLYCPYRSLCQRGIGAGAFDEAEDEVAWDEGFGLALNLEQVAEVEY